MKVPLSWLRDYVQVKVPTHELARRMSISICNVERIVRRGVPDQDGNLGLYRVGRVLEAGKHPNADRLQLCQVDVGEREPRQIVCGAWNFGAGATVAVALPGAVLPGGHKLERTKLRVGEAVIGLASDVRIAYFTLQGALQVTAMRRIIPVSVRTRPVPFEPVASGRVEPRAWPATLP